MLAMRNLAFKSNVAGSPSAHSPRQDTAEGEAAASAAETDPAQAAAPSTKAQQQQSHGEGASQEPQPMSVDGGPDFKIWEEADFQQLAPSMESFQVVLDLPQNIMIFIQCYLQINGNPSAELLKQMLQELPPILLSAMQVAPQLRSNVPKVVRDKYKDLVSAQMKNAALLAMAVIRHSPECLFAFRDQYPQMFIDVRPGGACSPRDWPLFWPGKPLSSLVFPAFFLLMFLLCLLTPPPPFSFFKTPCSCSVEHRQSNCICGSS